MKSDQFPLFVTTAGIVAVVAIAATVGLTSRSVRGTPAGGSASPELPVVESTKKWANGITTTKFCLEGQAVWYLNHGGAAGWVPGFKNGVPERCVVSK